MAKEKMLNMSKKDKNETCHKRLGINMILDFLKAKSKDRWQLLNAFEILREMFSSVENSWSQTINQM